MVAVKAWFGASAACVVASLLAACSHDFGVLYAEETPSEKLWGRDDDACHRCLHASCTEEAASCASDGACRTQVGCLQSCSDASCAGQCVVQGEAAPVGCWRAACFDDCWVENGWADGTEQLLGGRMSAACGACFDRECKEEAQSCAADAACDLACYASCTDPPCADRCLQRTEGDPAVTCLRTKCFDECENGQRFDCLRRYRDPHDSPDEVTLSATIVDFLTNTPQGGLTVQVCPDAVVGCDEPVLETSTDAQGLVLLTVRPTQRPGPGVAAYVRALGPRIPPTRFYPEWPLGADREITLFTHSMATVAATYARMKVERIPGRAGVIAVLRDCQGEKAPFMRMKVLEGDEHTVVVYQRGVDLSPTFTETDNSGLAIIANVPAGAVTLQGFANDGKDLVIERTLGVEAEGISWVAATPIQQ
jgi:hypothetical protein